MGNCELCRSSGSEVTPRRHAKGVRSVSFLKEVQLFQRLPPSLHPKLAEACEYVEFQAKQVIIRQGDPGHEFFVIKSGEAHVYHDDGGAGPVHVATLTSGDHFGETALLRSVSRSATIRAETNVVAIKITREKFEELGLRDRLEFTNRKAVGAGVSRRIETKEPDPKSDAVDALLTQAIWANGNLNQLLTLDEKIVKQLVSNAWKEHVKEGTCLIQEEDLQADYFYIVQDGCFQISIQKVRHSPKGDEYLTENLGTVTAGGSFGELALLHIAPRAASVTATADSIVWVIDRGHFKKTLAEAGQAKRKEYIRYLERVESLVSLSTSEKEQVANCFQEMVFKEDDIVFQQGDTGTCFYILYQGEVLVLKDGDQEARLKATEAKAHVIGERALLKDEPRESSVKVISKTARALMLDRMSFRLLRTRLSPPETMADQGMTSLSLARAGRIRFRDLRMLGLLGCGGFGYVELAQHAPTGKTYALKAMSKGHVVQSGMQEAAINEKKIQMMCDSSFIIKLLETYNSPQTLYYLMELALGGEVYSTYNRLRLHGSAAHAKYYGAGVVLALEHMHSLKITYRDLKPENLLLNIEGHVKLTDMGLAKVTPGKTFTTCGTPDYFAPEIIQSTGHSMAVDWWALGILYFELMAGNPPFESTSAMNTYTKVMKGIDKVDFPQPCCGLLEAIIKGLLNPDPASRLCMLPGGTTNLKKQAWYKGFSWDAFGKLEMEPPYKPEVSDPLDPSQVSGSSVERPPQVRYVDDHTGWDRGFATSA